MAASRVRLIDVARRADVSIATASLALSGKGRISTETRGAVLRAAEQLGYRANSTARNLRRGRHGVLAVHLPQRPSNHEFFMEFVYGVIEAADQDDLAVLLLGRGCSVTSFDAVVVLDANADDDTLPALLAGSAPVVAAEPIPDGLPRPALTVTVDHERLVRTLLDRLDGRGHRRIGLVAPPALTNWIAVLRRTYLAWCDERHREPMLADLNPAGQGSTVDDAVRPMVDGGADAIVVGPEGALSSVRDWLEAYGRNDIGLAAYVRTSTTHAERSDAPAIDLHPRAFGRECATLAIQLVGHDLSARPMDVEFTPPGLVTGS